MTGIRFNIFPGTYTQTLTIDFDGIHVTELVQFDVLTPWNYVVSVLNIDERKVRQRKLDCIARWTILRLIRSEQRRKEGLPSYRHVDTFFDLLHELAVSDTVAAWARHKVRQC